MKLRIPLFALILGILSGFSLSASETMPEKTTKKANHVKLKERPLDIIFINDSADVIYVIDGSQIGESMRPLVSELFLKELNKRVATPIKPGKQMKLPKVNDKENILFVYVRQKVNKNSPKEHFYRRFKVEEKEKKARQNGHRALLSFSSIELLARGKRNDPLGNQFKVTDYSMKSPLLGCLDNED